MPVSITAADSESRIIAGRIVQWDSEGNTSAGRTKFLPNSIEFGKNTKLVLEHNQTKPLGKLIEWSQDDSGVTASFKIAKTNAGNDALEEAATGLRSDFSVGVEVGAWDNRDGVMAISASKLIEVSLVTDGAIPGAEVEKVAATETPGAAATESNAEPQSEEPKPEGDDLVSETVSEAVSTETVEAAKVEVKATSYPLNSQSVRNPIISAGTYLEHTLKASLGNQDSALYVRAADDSFTTNPAFDKVSYLDRVIDTSTKFGRPTIDAFGGTTATKFIGTTVSVPKITGNSTVTVEAEEGATSETGITSAYVTGTVNKYAGMQTFSQEILDLQGTPVFYDAMLKNLYAAYAKATNEAVIAECVSGGTAGTNQAATAAGLIAFHATESAAAYLATGDFAQAYIAGSSQWVLAMGSVDTTGRPIFNAGQPSNSAGSVGGTSARGKFLDLDFYADRSMVATTIDDSAFIVVPSAMLLLEQAPQKLQVAQLGSGQYEVSIHGYLVAKTLIAGGIRRFNIA